MVSSRSLLIAIQQLQPVPDFTVSTFLDSANQQHEPGCLQAPVLLTQRHVQERIKLKVQAKVVMADAEWQQIAGQPTSSPGIPADPKRLMYMIFTSGEQAGLAFCTLQHVSM